MAVSVDFTGKMPTATGLLELKRIAGRQVDFHSEILDESPPAWVHFCPSTSDWTACWRCHRTISKSRTIFVSQVFESFGPKHFEQFL